MRLIPKAVEENQDSNFPGPRLLVGSIFSIAFLVLYSLLVVLDVWPEASALPGEVTNWCERAADGLILEPVNTVTNLAFVIVGLLILHRTDLQKISGLNSFTRNKSMSTVYAGSVMAIGLGSFAMHGTKTEIGSYLDWGGMLVFIFFPPLYRLKDFLGWSDDALFRNHIILSILVLGLELLQNSDDILGVGDGLRRFGWFNGFVWAVMIGFWIILEIRIGLERTDFSSNLRLVIMSAPPIALALGTYAYSHPWEIYLLCAMFVLISVLINDLETPSIERDSQKWVLLGTSSFILGMLVWPYGKEGSVYCNPDSILQIHGLWHLLCALATWCFYIHFMSERIIQSDDEE